MKGYLSIGAVSKEKNISIKSLRYYDRIGVFKPAYVNESTNYRYYTREQLYVLDAISLCVELGIHLSDFKNYVDEEGTFNLQGLLYDGKLMAEQKIAEIRERLLSVQDALRTLEGPDLKVRITEKEAPGPRKKKRRRASSSQKTGETAAIDTIISEQTEAVDDMAPSVEPVEGTGYVAAAEVAPAEETASLDMDAPAEIVEDTGDAAAAETDPDPAVEDHISYLASMYTKDFDSRDILTSPYAEDQSDSQQILRLFMLAQLLGMNASYPSGILYDYDDRGEVSRTIFIHVENTNDCNDKRLRNLPGGTYTCMKGEAHPVADHRAIMDDWHTPIEGLCFVEMDLLEENGEASGLELQVLF